MSYRLNKTAVTTFTRYLQEPGDCNNTGTSLSSSQATLTMKALLFNATAFQHYS